MRLVIGVQQADRGVRFVLEGEPAIRVLELKPDPFAGIERDADGRPPTHAEPVAEIAHDERGSAADVEVNGTILGRSDRRHERQQQGAE